MNDGNGKENIQLTDVEVIYLHGLGSGTSSPKGLLLQQELGALGAQVHCPDLNLPSFERLSPMRVIDHAQGLMSSPRGGGRLRFVVGSSFGAFVALHASLRLQSLGALAINGFVLLAPAIDPWHPESNLITPQVEELWERQESCPLFYQATQSEVPVHVSFLRELRVLGAPTGAPQAPLIIIHGMQDEVVHYSQSEQFCANNPGVELRLVEDNHALLADPVGLIEQVLGFMQRCRRIA